MSTDPFDHMEEAWRLDRNPFPAEAIHSEGQPYSADVFEEESRAFRRKLVRGAALGSINIGFLWSQGVRDDTGFGKTTLMREIAREINRDFGSTTLERAGVRVEKRMPLAAAYSNLDNLNATGLYPVLFNAVVDMARGSADSGAVLDRTRSRIVEKLETEEPSVIAQRLRERWLEICGTGSALRAELVEEFARSGASGIMHVLHEVSPTMRLRSGLRYFDFALGALATAGVDHIYVMIDQLEDLATTRTVTAAKRSREIGRIRDMLEGAPYANRVHFVFTFHNSAARKLEQFWEQNRLPSFEISSANDSSVVVLKGFRDESQVRNLLGVYLAKERNGPVDDDLLPFEPGALGVLKEVSEGRAGILLNRAHALFDFAAKRGFPSITENISRKFFAESGDKIPDIDEDANTIDESEGIDDLLLGS